MMPDGISPLKKPETPLSRDIENERRFLVAAGTSHYERMANADLPRVPEEIQRVVDCLARLGYARALESISLDPTSSDLRNNLQHWCQTHLNNNDIFAIYYSGHGFRDQERFYLGTRDSIAEELDASAIPAEELMRWVAKNTRLKQILVVIDTCYSGAGAAECMQVLANLTKNLGGGPLILIIAAARSKDEADQDALSIALAEVLSNTDGKFGRRTQHYLAIDEVLGAVVSYIHNYHPKQQANWWVANGSERSLLFPNPLHDARIPSGLDLEAQRTFLDHWIPKARGAEANSSAWYFTGRDRALREIVDWLRGTNSETGAYVVTGGAGCGKSALLACIVTLSDLSYRNSVLSSDGAMGDPDSIPPERIVDVAIHARRKVLTEIVELAASMLGFQARNAEILVDAIRQRGKKTVIILDALDEADEGHAIVLRLLLPLAEMDHVFLLIGTRPDSTSHERRFQGLGQRTYEIDLDRPCYIGENDVANYVKRRLLAAEEPERNTPYRSQPDLAQKVAEGVAQQAGHIFLVARTIVQTLLDADEPMDTSQYGWIEALPAGLDEAFEQFLAGLDRHGQGGISSSTVLALLLPLSFAEGEGLPWAGIWAPLASALSGVSINDTDIALLHKHVAAFIVEATEQDRSVYRLYHESIGEHLRKTVKAIPAAHRCIFKTLHRLVPRSKKAVRPDWLKAHPYMLTHLAAHAFKAGCLEELSTDSDFVACADPVRFLRALKNAKDSISKQLESCYVLAWNRLVASPPSTRLSYLQLTSRQQADNLLAMHLSNTCLEPPWRIPWAHWSRVQPHQVLWRTVSSVKCIALADLSGRSILISGTLDGTLSVFDLTTGRALYEPLHAHKGSINSAAVGSLKGRSILITGGGDGTVRLWDLLTGEACGKPLLEGGNPVDFVAFGRVAEKPIVISADLNPKNRSESKIRVWNANTRDIYNETVRWNRPFAAIGGQTTLIEITSNWYRNGIIISDPLTRHVIKQVELTMDWAQWTSDDPIAIAAIAAHPMMVYADYEDKLWKLDLETGNCESLFKLRTKPTNAFSQEIYWAASFLLWRSNSEFVRHSRKIKTIAIGGIPGEEIVAAGGFNGDVNIWSFNSTDANSKLLRGHQGPVNSIAIGNMAGLTVIATGGEDRTVRVWDLSTEQPAYIRNLWHWIKRGFHRDRIETHLGSVKSVAVGTLNQMSIAISAGEDDTVRVWNLVTGKNHGKPLRGHTGWLISATAGDIEGQPVVVSGGNDGSVRLWDLKTGRICGKSLIERQDWVTAVAMAKVNGQTRAVSGSRDGTVRLWNLPTVEPCEAPFYGHDGRVTSVALGDLKNKTICLSGGIDGTARVWDLTTGKPIGDPLECLQGSVNSVAFGTMKDRQVIITGGDNGTVQVWDLITRKALGEPLCGHQDWVTTIATCSVHEHSMVVSGSRDGTVRLWNLANRTSLTIDIGSAVNSVALAPEAVLVVGGVSGILLIKLNPDILGSNLTLN
jgi:WD40 repeat protein